ncbi:unnamed protein product [Ectocarpus sp. CCAP 1310/34]|nr:unnamed protein product [Ectocarpus sp. CCAP 1310/34]
MRGWRAKHERLCICSADRCTRPAPTYMWMAYNMAFIYTMASLITDDVATSLARRDAANFFSPQDCINFLRFTQPQTTLLTTASLITDDVATSLARRDAANFFSPQDCINFLRFTQPQIMLMLDLLLIPAFIRTDCGFIVSGREALCVLLYRLAFPCRLKDMRLVFGLSESCICETFNRMLHFLDFKWGWLLSVDVERLKPRLLVEFAEAIYNAGCPLTHCWGFIDETIRGIARVRLADTHQLSIHAIKFQGVVTPDGLFVDLWGLVLGTRHDSYLLAQSGLMQKLAAHFNSPSGRPYCLYGDPAYGLSDHLVCPFSAASYGPLTPEMADFNQRMSHCRVTVEWGFKEMTSKWAFVDMKSQQKYLLSPVGKQYRVATLLSNMHSCLNGGNQISQYFNLQPPTLEEYLKV